MDYRKQYAERYGIKIPDNYDIHHIDLDHDNNAIENLILIPHSLHMKLHKCVQSGLLSIAEEVLTFRFIMMPNQVSATSYIIKECADVYADLFEWAAKKEFEEIRIKGGCGYMPYSYNEFRNE